MTDPYTGAEASSASSSLLWAVLAAVALLVVVAVIHGPELLRRVRREAQHRADLRRVTGRG